MHSQARRARPAKSCPECDGQTLRARLVDTSQPSAECYFLDSHAAEYGRSARSDDRPAQWRVDDGRATRERWGRQEESRVCLKMRALFRPFSADVALPAEKTTDCNRPGSPEFAQERDNRSKKAKFIFREIGSIQATRLSPQPPPRNRVSRGRSLLGGDRPPFQGAARA